MKTKSIIAMFLIFASATVFASKPGKSKISVSSKVITLNESYSKVSIGANLNVVVLKDVNAHVSVEGNSALVNGLNLKVVNGTLFISAKNTFTSQGTIYIPAKNFTEIGLSPNSKVSSEGFLNCNNLTVYLSEGCVAAIKNRGQLEVKPSSDTELNYEKYATIQE